MAQKKITDLQTIASLDGSEYLPVDDTIQTYKATITQIKNFVLSAGSVAKTALATAVQNALNPTGAIIAMGTDTLPSGWLECNGAAVSRTTYADLFAAIGERWGEGDNSTTFNLPDLRGKFPRGWDHGAGNDPDAAGRTAQATGGATGDNVGSIQSDNFESHSHIQQVANGAGASTTVSNFGGANNLGTPSVNRTVVEGGNETRPINAYVMYIIKT